MDIEGGDLAKLQEEKDPEEEDAKQELIRDLRKCCLEEESLYNDLKEKELKLLSLRQELKSLEVERIEKRTQPRKVNVQVTEYERKVIMDLTARRDQLRNYHQELSKALEKGEGGAKIVYNNQQDASKRIGDYVCENNSIENYTRGEYFSSSAEATTAYKYHLSSKESRLAELDQILAQLQTEDDLLKKQIQQKQEEYQREIAKREK